MAQLTLYPAAGANAPVDGVLLRGDGKNETFSTIRDSAGESASPTADGSTTEAVLLRGSTTTNQFRLMQRSIIGFDLSSIPTGSTIQSATLSLYGLGKTTSLGSTTLDIVSATPASNNNLVAADYNVANYGSTVYADISSASFSTSAYNDLTLSANGITYLKGKIGTYVFFGARLGWDTDNSFGGSWVSSVDTDFSFYFADQTGTTNDPKLVIIYTPPGGFFNIL